VLSDQCTKPLTLNNEEVIAKAFLWVTNTGWEGAKTLFLYRDLHK